jgi:RsiW-degrading membrane proteinase PrsW (M82 family)
MAIEFDCACGKRLRAREALSGKRAKCPVCGTVHSIPPAVAPESESPEAIGRAPARGPTEGSGLLTYQDADGDAPYELADEPRHRPPATPPTPSTSPSAPSLRYEAPRTQEAPSRRDVASPGPAGSGPSPREFLYLILVLALVPLGFSLLAKESGSLKDRFERTMGNASPEVVAQVQRVLQSKEDAGLDDLLAALPHGRLDETAHLPRQTWVHWGYGALAAAAFWALTVSLFPREPKTPGHLLLVGLFTGTIGIILLLACQYLAGATQGVWFRGRGIILVAFYIAKFIGFSYASANDPNSNFLFSFVGFTCGVGLCEELCKALPLIVYFRRDDRMGWRGACVWGLASGAGFGVSEGIMYSGNYYNGISPVGIYIVRFVSCVALHALWSASVGITIWRRQDSIQGDIDWSTFSVALLRILAVPMVLHGLYDTLLKKDMNLLALTVGAVSFAWFAWQVESARGETAEEPRRRLARA